MATLKINGKDYEAKCNFRFDRYADKNYGETNENGQKENGFQQIYMQLLQYSNTHLVAFWDCALEYLGKNKPSLVDIEEALMERFEEDEDTLPAFKDAFEEVDQSAFFKRAAKNFWKNIELMKSAGSDEDEKETNRKAYETMKANYNELTESITTSS